MTLEQELAHVSKSYRRLSDANAKYREELAELHAENKILKERVALYDRMNHDLMSRLASAA